MAVGQRGDTRIAAALFTSSDYIALFKTDGSEVSGGGYSRIQANAANFGQSTEQGATNAVVNAGNIDFGTATAAWGSVDEARIYTSASTSTDANLVFTATFNTRTVESGDSFSFATGNFRINIT